MNSYISLALAAERAKDMQCDAAVARYQAEVRRARRARRAARRAQVTEQTVHGNQAPDSYEDFLCQTAKSAMCEPTAAGRSLGQAVR
jgi:hypothetical protein